MTEKRDIIVNRKILPEKDIVAVLQVIGREATGNTPWETEEWTRRSVDRLLNAMDPDDMKYRERAISEVKDQFKQKIVDTIKEGSEIRECLETTQKTSRILRGIANAIKYSESYIPLDFAITRYEKQIMLAQRSGQPNTVQQATREYTQMVDELIGRILSAESSTETIKQNINAITSENTLFLMEDTYEILSEGKISPDEFETLREIRRSGLEDKNNVRFKDRLLEITADYNQRTNGIVRVADPGIEPLITQLSELISEFQEASETPTEAIETFNNRHRDAQLEALAREHIALLYRQKILLEKMGQTKRRKQDKEEMYQNTLADIRRAQSDYGIFNITEESPEVTAITYTLDELQGTNLSDEEKRKTIAAYKKIKVTAEADRASRKAERLSKAEEWREEDENIPGYDHLVAEIQKLEHRFNIHSVDEHSSEVTECDYKLSEEAKGPLADIVNKFLTISVTPLTYNPETLLYHQQIKLQKTCRQYAEITAGPVPLEPSDPTEMGAYHKAIFSRDEKVEHASREISRRITACSTVAEINALIAEVETKQIAVLSNLTSDFGDDAGSVAHKLAEFNRDNPDFSVASVIDRYQKHRAVEKTPNTQKTQSEVSSDDGSVDDMVGKILAVKKFDFEDKDQRILWLRLLSALNGQRVASSDAQSVASSDDTMEEVIIAVKSRFKEMKPGEISPLIATELDSLISSSANTLSIKRIFPTLYELRDKTLDLNNRSTMAESLLKIYRDLARVKVTQENRASALGSVDLLVKGMMLDDPTTRYYIDAHTGKYRESGKRLVPNRTDAKGNGSARGASFYERTQDFVTRLQQAVQLNDAADIARLFSGIGRKLQQDVVVFPMDIFKKKEKYSMFIHTVRDSEGLEAIPKELRNKKNVEFQQAIDQKFDSEFAKDNAISSLTSICRTKNGQLIENSEGLAHFNGTSEVEMKASREEVSEMITAERRAVASGGHGGAEEEPRNWWEKSRGTPPPGVWNQTKDAAGSIVKGALLPLYPALHPVKSGKAVKDAIAWGAKGGLNLMGSAISLGAMPIRHPIKTVKGLFSLPFKALGFGKDVVSNTFSTLTSLETYTKPRFTRAKKDGNYEGGYVESIAGSVGRGVGGIAGTVLGIPLKATAGTYGLATDIVGGGLSYIPWVGKDLKKLWKPDGHGHGHGGHGHGDEGLNLFEGGIAGVPNKMFEHAKNALGLSYFTGKELAKMLPGGGGSSLGNALAQDWGNFYNWYNLLSIWRMLNMGYENLKEKANFYNEMQAAKLGKAITKGAWDDLYLEFDSKYHHKENEKVNHHKEHMKQAGTRFARHELTNAHEPFALKAAFEFLAEEGELQDRDFRDPEIIKKINEWCPIHIPENITLEAQSNNPKLRDWVRKEVGKGLDLMWGKHTFANLRKKASQSTASKMNEYGESWGAEVQMADDKAARFETYYELITQGKHEELFDKYPRAQIMGEIKKEIDIGDVEDWNFYSVFQAMVLEQLIGPTEYNLVVKEYTNKYPVYCMMNYDQARTCGLLEVYNQHKTKGYDTKKNPFCAFYEGTSSLGLHFKSDPTNGRLGHYDSLEQREDLSPGERLVTARDLQYSFRTARSTEIFKVDNSQARLSQSGMNWSTINTAWHENNDGTMANVDKPSDFASAMVGFPMEIAEKIDAAHHIAEQLKGYGKGTKEGNHLEGELYKKFVESYRAIAKLYGVVNTFNQTRGQNVYTSDSNGAPLSASEHISESANRTGTTNYQKMTLSEPKFAPFALDAFEKIQESSNSKHLTDAVKNLFGFKFFPVTIKGKTVQTGETFSQANYDPTGSFNTAVEQLFAFFRGEFSKSGHGRTMETTCRNTAGNADIDISECLGRTGAGATRAIDPGDLNMWITRKCKMDIVSELAGGH